jgi:hypothetical protein
MENVKIIETIKKLFALAGNNPNEHEAQAAALKAQRMMAKYHINATQVSVEEKTTDDISEKNVVVGTGNKWKYSLALIIAKNFRCRMFTLGSEVVVFYGHEVDTEIASLTFRHLFSAGSRGATNFYQNRRNEAQRRGEYFCGRGLKNNFLIGFLQGLQQELEKQSVALMVVVPKEVNDAYEKRSEGFKARHNTLRYSRDEEARESGRKLGRDSVRARQLASATV